MDKNNAKVVKSLDCGKVDSNASSESVPSTVSGTHLANCGFKYTNTCICESLIKLAKAHDKLQRKPGQNISQSSESFHSIILAGSAQCVSQKSSDNSFYSAESTIDTKQLPSNSNETASAVDSSTENSIKLSKEIESLSVVASSLTDTLNENIKVDSTEPESSTATVSTDIDLNKAQNLFKSTNLAVHDPNHDVDGASETSNSISYEDDLHFLLGSHSTTQYPEVPLFLKSFTALSKNESDETSNEVARRLTRSLLRDPPEFAKRLITIIEESGTNYDLEHSAVSVNKMAAAFLKMCKYVEDESMPSMCDRISPARHEASQVSYSRPIKNIVNNNVLSQVSSTPKSPSIPSRKFDTKISPLSLKKNPSKIQSSPLYVSTLTRSTRLPQTPTTPRSPRSTPGSSQSHNDSSFTFWEKKCDVRPVGKPNRTMPEVTNEEMEKIAKSKKQLCMLEAADSPNKSPMNTEKNIYNRIHCDRQNSPRELDTSENYSPENMLDTVDSAPPVQSNYNEIDMMDNILYELAEKRKRCLETEWTIRQIDAESSAYSNSPQSSGSEESNKILDFLNTLKNDAGYHKLMQCKEIELSNKRNDSVIEDRILSQSPRNCRSKFKQSNDESSNNFTLSQNDKKFNVTMRKPLKTPTPRKKSPNLKTSRKNVAEENIKSTNSRNYIKSPALMSRRVASSNMVVKSISPIDSASTSESSKSASIIKAPKSTDLLRSQCRTPRDKSPNFKIWPPRSQNKSKSRLCNKTDKPSTMLKSSSSDVENKSCATSRVKSVTQPKSNYQLLTSNKGFTLEYLNSTSRSRSPRVIINSKFSTATKSQNESKRCIPTVCVTSSTPSKMPCKKSEQPGILREKNWGTPIASTRNAEGKFFNTPGKTPIPKIRPKPTTFFSVVDGARKPVLKSQILTKYYSPGEVKSPVAEYVHGTDTTLIQNICGKKNEYLLTPKSKNQVTEQLKFNLSAKNKVEKKPKRNPTFNYTVESNSDTNDENLNYHRYNHPKVSYHLPSTVHEIKAATNSPRGARARQLMEATDSRVVIQHAGRAIPQIISVEQLDMSIHVAKSAEKKKFVLRSNDTKY